MNIRSRSCLILIALASFLTTSTVAHANDNPAQHFADCTVKSTFAQGIIEKRLRGAEKQQFLSHNSPPESDDQDQMMDDAIDRAYSYDIENGSVEDFRDQVFDECMAEG